MPKSKHAPALFELYGKGSTDSEPDRLARPHDTIPEEAVSGFRSTIASVARTIGGAEETRRAPRREEGGVAPPVFTIADGRVHLALTSRAAGLVAFGLLALACMIFVMGQRSGHRQGLAAGQEAAQKSLQREAVDEIELARNSKPIPNLFEVIGTSPVIREASAPPVHKTEAPPPVTLTAQRLVESTTSWVKGHTYVVVQSFRGDAREDAVNAREYLSRQGVESEIFGSSQRGYRLIAVNGFNRDEAGQRKMADRFLKKLRGMGAAYFKSGGRYKLEGYFATLTSDSW